MESLIQKYSSNIPRYTSYPTVPDWKNNINHETWLENITPFLTEEEISLYIHIPFCHKLCTFCACNKIVTENYDNVERYINALEEEIKGYIPMEKSNKIRVKQFHIGGGTPTFLHSASLDGLFTMLDKYFVFEKDAEKSIEAHPEFTNEEHILTLQKWSFNRISLGIQDFSPQVQEIINRKQSYENIISITHFAKKHGFNSINYDFIYGLPLQNEECIEAIIAGVNEARPDRIAFYGYAHVPWKSAMQRKYSEADLPTPHQRLALFMQGKKGFEAAGYSPIGMDHFALPTDELFHSYKNATLHRNFMGYTVKNTNALLGLGVSAISETPTAYRQNTKNLSHFYKNPKEVETSHLLTTEELHTKRIILQVMTQFSITTPTLTPILLEMQNDGLLTYENGILNVTEVGKVFIRNIAAEFDLHRKEKQIKQFSQSV